MRLESRDLAFAPVSVTGGAGALTVAGSPHTGDMEEGEEEEEEVSGGGGEGPKRAGGGGWLGWEGGTWNPGEKLFRLPTTFLSTSLSIPIDIRPTKSVVAGLLTAGGMKILLNGFLAGRGSDSFGERIGGGGEPMDKSFKTSVLLASKLIVPNFLVTGSFWPGDRISTSEKSLRADPGRDWSDLAPSRGVDGLEVLLFRGDSSGSEYVILG